MRPVYLLGVGLVGPGLASWRESLPVLAGQSPYREGELAELEARSLPPNERRRATPAIKLALKAAEEAVSQVSLPRNGISSVFATAAGDTWLMDKILRSLCLPERPVSPTQFHNSVHNAPAGYWSIASGSPAPSTTVSAHEATFAAGLFESCVQALGEHRPVLLVAYDHPAPSPLAEAMPPYRAFAAALLLGPEPPLRGAPALSLATVTRRRPDRLCEAGLEVLRATNPAACALPLLRAVARGGRRAVVLPAWSRQQLSVEVEPA